MTYIKDNINRIHAHTHTTVTCYKFFGKILSTNKSVHGTIRFMIIWHVVLIWEISLNNVFKLKKILKGGEKCTRFLTFWCCDLRLIHGFLYSGHFFLALLYSKYIKSYSSNRCNRWYRFSRVVMFSLYII